MIVQDLEALTGTIIQGDCTRLVVDILKETNYKDDLLEFGTFCTDKKLVEKIKGGKEIVNRQKIDRSTVEEDNRRPSLEDWFSNR